MDTVQKRALVIRIGALGDVLLTRRLTYSLSLAGLRSTLFAPARHASVLLGDPWIDALLDSESPSMAAAFAGVWPEDHRGFDVAVVISNSDDLANAAQDAAISVIQASPFPVRGDVSIARQWADAARDLAPSFALGLPHLTAPAGPAAFGGAIVIHPGSGSAHKNWPIERFVEVGRALMNEGHSVVWVRGPAEATSPPAPQGFALQDKPTLDVLSATLSQSRLFIGNDSGVSHLAAAVGAPTLAIYGPTDDRVWRPDGPRAHTLRASSGVLSAVTVDEVLGASRDSIAGAASPTNDG